MKTNVRNRKRKILACLLVVALLVPCVASLPVFAADTTGAFYVAPDQAKQGSTGGYYTTLVQAVVEVADGVLFSW